MKKEHSLADMVIYFITRRAKQLPDMRFYAILDNARDERIYPALAEFKCEYRHLYRGSLPRVLEEVAPHLVEVNPQSEFARWLIEQGWGMSWGIFLASPARLDVLKNHFRDLVRVKDEEGRIMYFRYYDPRVFRVYMPTCRNEELRAVFGQVRHFFVEGEDSHLVIEYRIEDSKFLKRTSRLVSSAHPKAPVS
jgi:hypothetical protein